MLNADGYVAETAISFIIIYDFSKFSILIGSQAVRKNSYPKRDPYFLYLDRCPGYRIFGKKFYNIVYSGFLDVSPLQTCVSLKFTDKNFKQQNFFWLSMHAYRILNCCLYIYIYSETDDSRFNSRDLIQPYNKPITDLAYSVFIL